MGWVQITKLFLIATGLWLVAATTRPSLSAPPARPLLFLYGTKSPLDFQAVTELARDWRLPMEIASIEMLPDLVAGGEPKYSALVIDDYGDYLGHSKRAIDFFCRRFDVGVLFLHVPQGQALNDSQLVTSGVVPYQNLTVSPSGQVHWLSKPGYSSPTSLWGRYFTPSGSGAGYQSVLLATEGTQERAIVMADLGKFDGIRRIFFGPNFVRDWTYDLILADSLRWLARHSLGMQRERWVGVDIDDIFLPTHAHQGGVKMHPADVEALLAAQREIETRTQSAFKFHVGYNSHWFRRSVSATPEQDAAGDEAFLASRDRFYWFDHLPDHERTTDKTFEQLEALMEQSKRWAANHDVLRFIGDYHVSPYHSGIFPIYEPIYQAWQKVWKARSTSTVHIKKGFSHGEMKVAPRTDLGIPWNTYSWNQADKNFLLSAANGGFLFRRVLFNPVSIFMTHQANFARDRVALHTFLTLVRFVSNASNLTLVNLPSGALVEKQFQLDYPEYLP